LDLNHAPHLSGQLTAYLKSGNQRFLPQRA